MHTIAKSAPFRRKTETDVPKSSILEVLKRICSMSEKNMVLRKDDRPLKVNLCYKIE